MLVLSSRDIESVISYEEMIEAIERAYVIYEEGKYYMPDRFHVDYKNKTLLYMPCFLDDVFGTKILTVFPENVEKKIPSLDGLMLLNDFETGKPTCLMDGKILTALRTGAVGGVGIKYTTPEDVKTVGLIGAGVQGFYQVLYACKVRNFKKVYIFDEYVKDLTDFVDRLRKVIPTDVEIIICKSSEDLVRRSDVVITATTATEPTMPNSTELLRGKHFIGIGSYKPTMREYPDALSSLVEDVYIDADIALEETGDLIQPIAAGLLKNSQVKRISKLIASGGEIKDLEHKTTFFKTVGIAIFDIVAANAIYKKAVEAEVGYLLD
ncbi:ornithine cyclodeaminase [Anaerosphaera aminiphila DSM 21120]|uniref:Ornithine cyclodeaminase n=1 Tax=Anaerosphaera aminiphila DSM 21120 TaxID=1120995 RepID=A0A1M5Q5A5_9FIRM|nr:ornithine cyclodeaminase family protein [Anaerosphaera aminiphila]SHH09040.1 ornithine cyclodeaminase [Anaerosphaera aminiphila DSM 21120]